MAAVATKLRTAQSSTQGGLIISIKEARKILGKDAHAMSDSQIEDMIRLLSDMATDFLQN